MLTFRPRNLRSAHLYTVCKLPAIWWNYVLKHAAGRVGLYYVNVIRLRKHKTIHYSKGLETHEILTSRWIIQRYAIQARPLYIRKLPQRYKDTQTATGIMCTRQQIVANRYYGHTQAAFIAAQPTATLCDGMWFFLLRSWCPSIPNSQWQAIPQETI